LHIFNSLLILAKIVNSNDGRIYILNKNKNNKLIVRMTLPVLVKSL